MFLHSFILRKHCSALPPYLIPIKFNSWRKKRQAVTFAGMQVQFYGAICI